MYQEVLKFWFEETEPKKQFEKDLNFDKQILARFSKIHEQAVKCELHEWRKEPAGRLAEIIVLDQFSRNMFRDTARAFSQDAQALTLAQEALALGADQQLDVSRRMFFYLPFMHSESSQIHEISMKLFETLGFETALEFEIKHKDIIDCFARYPHRNQILGRESTEEELEFLKQPGSGF